MRQNSAQQAPSRLAVKMAPRLPADLGTCNSLIQDICATPCLVVEAGGCCNSGRHRVSCHQPWGCNGPDHWPLTGCLLGICCSVLPWSGYQHHTNHDINVPVPAMPAAVHRAHSALMLLCGPLDWYSVDCCRGNVGSLSRSPPDHTAQHHWWWICSTLGCCKGHRSWPWLLCTHRK
jgi:hypothetical protein